MTTPTKILTPILTPPVDPVLSVSPAAADSARAATPATAATTATATATTTTATATATSGRGRLVRCGAGFALGLALGATLGAAMRGFMRLASTDPSFSWSGTLFIIAVFALFGATQGLAAGARRAGLRRRSLTPLRVLAGAGLALIMTGAGMMLAPTIIGGGLAVHRHDWPRWARVVGGILAGADLVAVAALTSNELGFGLQALLASSALVLLYAGIVVAVGATMAPQGDQWRLPRSLKVIAVVALAGIPLLLSISLVGLAG